MKTQIWGPVYGLVSIVRNRLGLDASFYACNDLLDANY